MEGEHGQLGPKEGEGDPLALRLGIADGSREGGGTEGAEDPLANRLDARYGVGHGLGLAALGRLMASATDDLTDVFKSIELDTQVNQMPELPSRASLRGGAIASAKGPTERESSAAPQPQGSDFDSHFSTWEARHGSFARALDQVHATHRFASTVEVLPLDLTAIHSVQKFVRNVEMHRTVSRASFDLASTTDRPCSL